MGRGVLSTFSRDEYGPAFLKDIKARIITMTAFWSRKQWGNPEKSHKDNTISFIICLKLMPVQNRWIQIAMLLMPIRILQNNAVATGSGYTTLVSSVRLLKKFHRKMFLLLT
jgi:hypothetical protein